MRNFKLKDGYVLGQDIKGDGIVNLVVKKIDGSEDDVIVGQVVNGKYAIDAGDRELGKVAKLVYESKENEGYPSLVYASETKIPNGPEVDYDILSESDLGEFIIWTNQEDTSTDEIEPLIHTIEIEKASDESDEVTIEEESTEE